MNQRKNVTPEKISEKKKHEYFLCVLRLLHKLQPPKPVKHIYLEWF